MKIGELRIGNIVSEELVTYSGRKEQQIIVSIRDISHYDNFKPIPLTEEWLIKFGFEEELFGDLHTSDFSKGSISMLYVTGNTGIWQLRFEKKCNQTFIKYVHQLQNLYYALTGEELIIRGEANNA